ncbi:hypothetical protein HETIRDRAFT_453009 [Heterobasidion irregulare TC 32-1]|uniref:Uncharacterized protein n=1 Tax=Heterobasidion irregulare (strain TC 32-1) TaxID=747525 RepID=W4K3T4_HETIT|nr:uncharacterized protein HETIRDRAFT_453009 [Heterobasidion irregulare TC 32-1]ETW80000.1 hypothetical protein HETIRDRAFT_453009 [Heterobasidion irregulare TC 32-1]
MSSALCPSLTETWALWITRSARPYVCQPPPDSRLPQTPDCPMHILDVLPRGSNPHTYRRINTDVSPPHCHPYPSSAPHSFITAYQLITPDTGTHARMHGLARVYSTSQMICYGGATEAPWRRGGRRSSNDVALARYTHSLVFMSASVSVAGITRRQAGLPVDILIEHHSRTAHFRARAQHADPSKIPSFARSRAREPFSEPVHGTSAPDMFTASDTFESATSATSAHPLSAPPDARANRTSAAYTRTGSGGRTGAASVVIVGAHAASAAPVRVRTARRGAAGGRRARHDAQGEQRQRSENAERGATGRGGDTQTRQHRHTAAQTQQRTGTASCSSSLSTAAARARVRDRCTGPS